MLALIAGQGALPRAVAQAQATPPLVWAVEGFEPDDLTPDAVFSIETLGSVFADLKERGVQTVCLCGHIDRPDIDPARLDAATAPLVPKLTEALAKGDDGALRIVMALFEEAGFNILAAHEAAPNLLPRAGLLTSVQIGKMALMAAHHGEQALTRMGAEDQGQACIVMPDRVVSTETAAGTDAMLAAHEGTGFLFKAPKPNQDRRADLPTIGPKTARLAVEAGLIGIIIEHGGVMVLDMGEVFDILDANGLALWVREKEATT